MGKVLGSIPSKSMIFFLLFFLHQTLSHDYNLCFAYLFLQIYGKKNYYLYIKLRTFFFFLESTSLLGFAGLLTQS
jgi:hypothetical protein